MDELRLTHEQLQTLMELVAAQAMCAVIEHEARVHNPMNAGTKKALAVANKARLAYIEHLRKIMGPRA